MQMGKVDDSVDDNTGERKRTATNDDRCTYATIRTLADMYEHEDVNLNTAGAIRVGSNPTVRTIPFLFIGSFRLPGDRPGCGRTPD